MKKTDELKAQIRAKRIEIEKFQSENQMNLAATAADELLDMIDNYKVAAAMEESDFKSFVANSIQIEANTAVDVTKLRNRAFNKLVFKRGQLTDEERNAYFNVTGSPGQPGQIGSIDEKGGYLVPTEQMSRLQEFRKAYVALKDYVSVVATNTTSGRWATLPAQDLEFQSFSELANIDEGDITFGQATYIVEDRGLIIPISNQLIADAEVNIIDVVGRQLAEGAVKSENKAILQPLSKLIDGDTEAGITAATAITSYQSINRALFKNLDASYYNNARIYTNQDGFLYLSNLEDGNNRPLFTPDVTAPDTYRYRGKEIVVVPNSTLPNSKSGSDEYAPFFIGDMAAYITFFERQGMELSTSTELFFKQYGTALRAVTRFGIVVTDPASMIALKAKI